MFLHHKIYCSYSSLLLFAYHSFLLMFLFFKELETFSDLNALKRNAEEKKNVSYLSHIISMLYNTKPIP